jgi:4-hydroxy-2-oxoheptanedioate aldolase
MTQLVPNRFKRALATGRKQVGLWLTLESPIATEIAAGAGFDWMLLDMEHTTVTLSQISAHLTAARGGTAELVVRVPSVDPVLIKGLLDAGIRSVMFPYVQTATEARLALASTLYPPLGVRGVSGNSRANNFTRVKDYLSAYAAEQCVIVQVESPEALAAIPEIGTIDGLDAIFIGPNDLAANMGFLGQPGAPEVVTAIGQGLEAIKRSGKAAGLLNYVPDQAKAQFAAGFDFIAVGSDASQLVRNVDALRAQFDTNV